MPSASNPIEGTDRRRLASRRRGGLSKPVATCGLGCRSPMLPPLASASRCCQPQAPCPVPPASSVAPLARTAPGLASLAKEEPMTTPVHFDSKIGEQFLRYARLVAARGYIHNTLGNMAIRAAHPDHPHGVAYTKHAEISLEEMGMENIVITDIPTSRLIYGSRTTSIGHNLNREILRLRPDIGAVIHVHDDATIAFFGSGAFREVKVLSLDMPFILGKPPYYLPAHLDVEADV